MGPLNNLDGNGFSGPSPVLPSEDNPGLCPDMCREEDRLKTFARWPLRFMQPETLARNGFYYLGRGDEVRCAFCKVEIMRWEEGDDPAKDHRRWAPQCPFLRNQTIDGNVPINPAVAVGHVDCNVIMPGPVHPEYASEAARLDTFQDWPKSMRQTPEELAEAGFYYIGQGDKTQCFYCGGGLRDWETHDVPMEQHAQWFGNCPYVQLVKGRNYVQKLSSKLPFSLEEEVTNMSIMSKPEIADPASARSRLCCFLLLLLSNTLTTSDLQIRQIIVNQGVMFLNWILISLYSGISNLLSLLSRSRCLTQDDWRRLSFKVYLLRALVLLSSIASGKQSRNGKWHLFFHRWILSLLKIFFNGIL